MSEYSICVVGATFLKAGDPIDEDWFTLFATPYDETTEPAPPGPVGTVEELVRDRLTRNNVGFHFSFVGTWLNGSYSCGPEEMLAEERDNFVTEFLPALLVEAGRLLQEARRRWHGQLPHARTSLVEPDAVAFHTLWEYEAWRDYDGEYDSSVSYVGTFNPASLVAFTRKPVE